MYGAERTVLLSLRQKMDSISLAGTSCDTGNKRMKLEECQGGTVVDKDGHFRVNTHLIQQALVDDNQGSDLQNLGLSVFNQDEFEQGVMKQVDQAIAQEKTEQQKRSLVQELKSIEEDIRLVQDELAHITKSETTRQQENDAAGETVLRLETFHRQRENKLSQLKTLEKRQKITLGKLKKVETSEQKTYSDGAEDVAGQVLGGQGAESNKESEKERMIRLGDMTPFGTVFYMKCSQVTSDLQQFPSRYTGPSAKNESVGDASIPYQLCKVSTPDLSKAASVSRGRPQVRSISDEKECPLGERKWSLSCTRSHRIRKHRLKTVHNFVEDPDVSSEGHTDNDDSDYEPSISELDMNNFSEPSSNEEEIEGADMRPGGRRNRTVRKRNVVFRKGVDDNNLPSQCVRLRQEKAFVRERDDADENFYMKRLLSHQMTGGSGSGGEGDEEFDEGLVVPGVIWKRLYKYQKTGVRWLWELHCQQAGGIIGDEMGLGKTIQMIAFLAALKNSNLRHKDFKYVGLGPVVVVCPTTVMHQWVQEFHKWWPEFRVAILHSSGSYTGSQAQLVRSVVKGSGILVTSYNTVVNQRDILLPYNWHYIVLDEGHKIRNPDAQMTLCCKQFRTPHRIILSGSPIQNNLKELWSLFDFVFPGKLGTLPDFMANFSVPIVQGGYANATQVQVETAYKCACVLRDTINPYLLRRMKADVKVCLDLPSKSEQVLFCRLTDGQREVYEEYLQSRECQAILAGKYQVFAGLITLRKICNHPDLSTGGPRVLIGQDLSRHDEQHYGFWQRSGKMIVVEALLKLWHRQGQRVLFFTQSRAMLDIIEGFVQDSQYIYLRMDGTTPISSRQPLISQFNKDSSVFVFLLTTRVGGLGVNLTGANRVIIYDPDWNPSTDAQARERAWRIGQKRQVTVYRLLTSGTIEEKIYHRQIFKQFLTNRILKDPKQRRFFKSNDVFELFTLGSKDDRGTETSAIFAGTGSDVKMPQQCAVSPMPTSKTLKSNMVDVMKKGQTSGQEESFCTDLDHSELERMHELARKLSRKMEEEKLRNLKGSRENNTNSDCVSKTDAEPVEKHSTSTDVTNAQHHLILKGNKNKKNTKNAKFEGQRIPHLVKSSNSTLFPRVEEDGDRASRLQDDYVLHKLFKKTGIQSVMKHDKIMDSSRADFALVEAEAIKVAKEAAAALRRSRAMCLPAMSGIPTWTGQHGGSSVRQRFGQKKNSLFISKYEESSTPVKETFTKRQMSLKKPKGKAKTMFDGSQAGSVALSSTQDVVSSSELLSDMHRRQKLSTDKLSMDASENSSSRSNEIDAKDHELIEDIRNFIAFMGDTNGQATTEELMTNFGPRLPKSDSAKFKAMLVQICDFKKTHGTGVWRLKQDFW